MTLKTQKQVCTKIKAKAFYFKTHKILSERLKMRVVTKYAA